METSSLSALGDIIIVEHESSDKAVDGGHHNPDGDDKALRANLGPKRSIYVDQGLTQKQGIATRLNPSCVPRHQNSAPKQRSHQLALATSYLAWHIPGPAD